MPLPFIYSRYFIVVQPILISVLLLDIFIVLELIFLKDSSIFRRAIALCFIFLICMLCISNSTNKVKHIENYIYELSHRYRGPLDFVIPYIKSNFENPERLVIATNYAELTYMYYLRSKVIIGYVGHNIKEELKMRPDIIIVRKRPAYTNRWRMLDTFLQRDRYKKFSFRVFDYPVNNIPEIDGHLLHLFKTKMARSKRERLDIYVKQ